MWRVVEWSFHFGNGAQVENTNLAELKPDIECDAMSEKSIEIIMIMIAITLQIECHSECVGLSAVNDDDDDDDGDDGDDDDESNDTK